MKAAGRCREWQGAWKDMREFVDDALNACKERFMKQDRPPDTVRSYLER